MAEFSRTLPDSDQVCGRSPEVDGAAAAEKDDDESAERFGRKTSSQTQQSHSGWKIVKSKDFFQYGNHDLFTWFLTDLKRSRFVDNEYCFNRFDIHVKSSNSNDYWTVYSRMKELLDEFAIKASFWWI